MRVNDSVCCGLLLRQDDVCGAGADPARVFTGGVDAAAIGIDSRRVTQPHHEVENTSGSRADRSSWRVRVLQRQLHPSAMSGSVHVDAGAPVVNLDTFRTNAVRLFALPEIGEQAAAEMKNPGTFVALHIGRALVRIAEPQTVSW